MFSGTKPDGLFDRDWEWASLVGFATSGLHEASLGVVSGRRRQGKSYLLQHLCRELDGFYFAATEGTEDESLRFLARAAAAFEGRPGAGAFDDWDQAVDALLFLGRSTPRPVVLDEFPYLCRAAPGLPSVLQRALGPLAEGRTRSQARLILCGSSLSFMGGLLSGTAPLRGRAGLELMVHSFDFRTAAAFWGITDARLAVLVHAIVGGTPAYRREFVSDDVPNGMDDFDGWVTRRVLSPASPLFREGRYLLAEDADLRDQALYHAVLAAIAEGSATRGGIANRIGRKSDALQHPLGVLEDAGFIRRDDDAFRSGRPLYRIVEPFIAFHHAIIRPVSAMAVDPSAAGRLWASSAERFSSAIVGPHFEELCRQWVGRFAAADTFGEAITKVGSAVVNDPEARRSVELDVVAFDRDGRLRAIGEAKWGETMGPAHLGRLARARELLAARGIDVRDCRLVCFSGAGFAAELDAASRSGDVVLVDLERLYRGS